MNCSPTCPNMRTAISSFRTGPAGAPSPMKTRFARIRRRSPADCWTTAARPKAADPPGGFIVTDCTPENITIRYLRFNYHKQEPEEIDRLESFWTTELKRNG